MMKRFYVIIISIICSVMANAQTFTKVTTAGDLEDGCRYIIVSTSANRANGDIDTENKWVTMVPVTISNNQITLNGTEGVKLLTFTNGSSRWCISGLSGGYLSGTLNSTQLITQASISENEKWYMSISSGNVSIKKDINGSRVVKYDQNSYSLKAYSSGGGAISLFKEVVDPTPQSLTLVAKSGANYYATFSSASAVEFTDAETTIYKVAPNGSENLTLTAIESKQIPANTGVLVKSSKTATAYKAIASAAAVEDNYIHPASEPMSSLASGNKFYKLAYNDYSAKTGLGFYWGADNGEPFTAKAGGAYLAIPASQAKSGFVFGDDDVVTAIQITDFYDADDSAAAVYNLAGQRVRATTKGLLIINGRKLFNK